MTENIIPTANKSRMLTNKIRLIKTRPTPSSFDISFFIIPGTDPVMYAVPP